MLSIGLIRTILRELVARRRAPRVPEPRAVMDGADQVSAYARAGRETSVMKPTHLFHTAQASEVIRPGDCVLDLGCGPATQLAQIASLNPATQFIGLDLSAPMLEHAATHLKTNDITNVSLEQADITDLRRFSDGSVDAVFSSMTLHHLSDEEALRACFSEIDRVLRSDGGVYLADWCRLSSKASMHYFAYNHADRQTESFTRDYWNSLRAAFSVNEYEDAAGPIAPYTTLARTFPAPIMIAFKSAPRRTLSPELRSKLHDIRNALDAHARNDLRDMVTLYRLGGLQTQALEKKPHAALNSV